MPTKAFLTIEDYGGEKSVMSFHVQDVGAGNYGSVTQDIDEVKDAIMRVIEGEVRVSGFTKTFPESADIVLDTSAQRERKWLVTMQDTTQFLDAGNTIANPGYLQLFSFEIATAKLELLGASRSDEVDYSLNLEPDPLEDPILIWAEVMGELEANVRSPWNHTAAVTPTQVVKSIRHVGRRT
jgi:hypothetical protein